MKQSPVWGPVFLDTSGIDIFLFVISSCKQILTEYAFSFFMRYMYADTDARGKGTESISNTVSNIKHDIAL